MRRILILLFCLPLFAIAQNKPTKAVVKPKETKSPVSKGFTITGMVKGLADGEEVQLLGSSDNMQVASAKVAQGKFLLTGTVAEPGLYYLVMGKRPNQYLYVENKKITVTGSTENLKALKVEGSASHKDFLAFESVFNPLFTDLNKSGSAMATTPQGPAYDSLEQVVNGKIDHIETAIDSFVKAKPASYVTPFLLFVTIQLKDDIAQLENRYNELAPSIQSSVIGGQLKSYIAENKIGAVGTEALDFTQPDTTGTPVSLSSFRGKYVLVDFWASWCNPCRQENPNVVKAYNKFHEKNFTVLGVSLDRPGQKDKWIDAINHDGLTWTHVSDLQFWNNAAAQLYHVQGIPFNILVDPGGKIIGKNLRGQALEDKLCEVLGCN
ncbi:MAG: AhpC/TSA family protein [Bacteroidetes bacterium]|nr:AhpC/TSA family protein [Bacteroidota bacterium]